MLKLHKIFLALGLGFVALTANASNLKMEMFKLNQDVNTLLEAKTVDEFRESANTLIAQVEKSTEYLPSKMDANDAQAVEGYKQAMQELITVVNEAAQIADKGNLDEAKTATRKLFDLKKKYHPQYK